MKFVGTCGCKLFCEPHKFVFVNRINLCPCVIVYIFFFLPFLYMFAIQNFNLLQQQFWSLENGKIAQGGIICEGVIICDSSALSEL